MTRDAVAAFAGADTEELAAAAANPPAPKSNLPNFLNFQGVRKSRKFTADRCVSRAGLRVAERLASGDQLATALLLQLLDALWGVVEEATLGLDAQPPGGDLVGHRLAHLGRGIE
jgi:hypothetical protein